MKGKETESLRQKLILVCLNQNFIDIQSIEPKQNRTVRINSPAFFVHNSLCLQYQWNSVVDWLELNTVVIVVPIDWLCVIGTKSGMYFWKSEEKKVSQKLIKMNVSVFDLLLMNNNWFMNEQIQMKFFFAVAIDEGGRIYESFCVWNVCVGWCCLVRDVCECCLLMRMSCYFSNWIFRRIVW